MTLLLTLLLLTTAADAPYLLVLGVAQDAGVPQAGCRRACCEARHQNPAARRFATSVAVIDPTTDQRWLFDATPHFTDQLALLDATHPVKASPSLTGIFLTHAHIGHYTGLMFLGREVMGAKQTPVYAMQRMADFLRKNGPWNQLVTLKNIVIRPLIADQTQKLNPRIQVTPLLVPHRAEYSETVAYLIKGPNKTALHLPDIDKWELWDHKIEDILKQVDYAFLDATFYDGDELPGRDMTKIPHPTIVQSMERFKDLPASEKHKVIFIHLNHTNPALEPDSDATAKIKAAGFRIAHRGMRLGL